MLESSGFRVQSQRGWRVEGSEIMVAGSRYMVKASGWSFVQILIR